MLHWIFLFFIARETQQLSFFVLHSSILFILGSVVHSNSIYYVLKIVTSYTLQAVLNCLPEVMMNPPKGICNLISKL